MNHDTTLGNRTSAINAETATDRFFVTCTCSRGGIGFSNSWIILLQILCEANLTIWMFALAWQVAFGRLKRIRRRFLWFAVGHCCCQQHFGRGHLCGNRLSVCLAAGDGDGDYTLFTIHCVCDGEYGFGEKDNGGDSKEGTCEVIDWVSAVWYLIY